MVLFLKVGAMFSLLTATMGGACLWVMGVMKKMSTRYQMIGNFDKR